MYYDDEGEKVEIKGNPIWVGDDERFVISPSSIPRAPSQIYSLDIRQNDGAVIFSKKEIHGDELLNLQSMTLNKVVKSIHAFWKSKKKFREHGFLWKRGIFMYGPPGGGKSSVIRAINDEVIKHDGVVFYEQSPHVCVEGLKAFRQVEPTRPICLILEDLEEILEDYSESTLLGLLDGEHQVDNVIFIATTNHPDKIPARFINRPSRFDEIVLVDVPGEEARYEFFKAKLPHLSKKELKRWVAGSKNLSIAYLREMIVSVECFGHSIEDTIEKLNKMHKYPPSEKDYKENALTEATPSKRDEEEE